MGDNVVNKTDSAGTAPMRLQTATLVEVLPTRVWIEEGLLGECAVMLQHEGLEPFEYAVFQYDHRYTSNSGVSDAAIRLARSLGASDSDPVQVRQRVPRQPTAGELRLQISAMKDVLACIEHGPNGIDMGQPLTSLFKQVMDRLGSGGHLSQAEAKEISARVAEALDREARPSFILVQEGGSSGELYVHAHETLQDAENDRISCSHDGAYRTSPIVEVPGWMVREDFFETLESVLAAGTELECVDVPEGYGDDGGDDGGDGVGDDDDNAGPTQRPSTPRTT